MEVHDEEDMALKRDGQPTNSPYTGGVLLKKSKQLLLLCTICVLGTSHPGSNHTDHRSEADSSDPKPGPSRVAVASVSPDPPLVLLQIAESFTAQEGNI